MIETEALTAVLILLILGVVTPGPNNITCIVHSSIHGPRSNIVLITGMATGFLIVHITAGLLVSSIEEDSTIQQVLEIIGVLFFMAIAIKVYTLNPSQFLGAIDEHKLRTAFSFQSRTIPKLGFTSGMLMQFVNGKEWTMVSAIMALSLEGFGGGLPGILLISAITIPGGVLAMTLWTYTGGKLMTYIEDETKSRRIFRTLGVLLMTLALVLVVL